MLEGVELFCCATARLSGIRENVNAICKQHELSHPYLPLHFCKGWKVLSFITLPKQITHATSRNNVGQQCCRRRTGDDVKYRCST